MTNILQDPLVLIYDKLFFELSLGNFNLRVTAKSGLLEEYFIIREEYYSKLGLLEKILPFHTEKSYYASVCNSEEHAFKCSRLLIDLIIYTNVRNNELFCLGLRVHSFCKLTLSLLGASSKCHIQKIMFLISRGLLKSPYHQINQKTIRIELD